MTTAPRLEMRGIVKRYGEIVAVRDASFSVEAGEIHALVGENGAGKSTLMKILAGAIPKDAGAVLIDGHEVDVGSPAASIALGIGMIPQDRNLVPELTVAENILLGAEPTRPRSPFLDRPAMERVAAAALATLGDHGDVRVPLGELSLARRQVVEIARALTRKVRVFALDEPTAPLSPEESASLFATVRRLRGEGVGILYISHRLDEIFEIADRVTVLRDGAVVATARIADVDRKTLIRWMVGREMDGGDPPHDTLAGEEILRLEGVGGGRLRGIDLVLRHGEILGLSGLVGAGRTELARLIFAADPRTTGRMFLHGREIAPRSPGEAIDCGIGLLTEDRNHQGLVLPMSVQENITLAGLARLCRGPFVDRARERAAASGHALRLRIKTPSLDTAVEQLSGGNRQKVILARWLETRSKLLIFDEPTAGIDVGARLEIFGLIRELVAAGTGVIVVSSDLDELLTLCTRIVVLCEGRIAGELASAEATRERIMTLATSHRTRRATA